MAVTAVARTVARACLYLVLLVATSMLLYGILAMRADVADEQPGGSCLLWAGLWKMDATLTPPAMAPYAGPQSACEFVLLSAVAQLLLAVLFSIVVVIRKVSGKFKEASAVSYVELVVVILAVILALATASAVTGGLYKTCSNLLAHWPDDGSGRGSAYGEKPNSCHIAYFAWSGQGQYRFYRDLFLAQIGSWVTAFAWLLHVILTCRVCITYRRGDEDGDGQNIALL